MGKIPRRYLKKSEEFFTCFPFICHWMSFMNSNGPATRSASHVQSQCHRILYHQDQPKMTNSRYHVRHMYPCIKQASKSVHLNLFFKLSEISAYKSFILYDAFSSCQMILSFSRKNLSNGFLR